MTDTGAAKPRSRRGGGKRKPLSCLACRKQKLRCDRRIPCSTCIRYRREGECRQNPAPAPVPSSRRIRQSSLPITEGEDESTVGAPAVSAAASVRDSRRPGHIVGTTYSRDSGVDGALSPSWLPGTLGSLRQQQTSSSSTASADGFASLAELLGLRSMEMESSTTPLTLPQILAEANRVDHLSSWWTFLDPQNRKKLWRQRLSAVLPSRSQCDLLINYYLEHINWIFQTIHVPSFRREYSRFWESDINQVDLIWLSLLLTVISVSALYVPLEAIEVVGCPRDSIRQLAHVWHLASQHALKTGDHEARPCLTQLQTFSVTQLYWYATNNIETLNSNLGQAVRNAQAINLDKDTSASTCLEDELRHRLWWDLVDADMFQTVCLDRQPLIRLQQPGVPLPLNCDDEDITKTSINSKPLEEPTRMSMNIYRAQIFQLLNRRFCAGNGTGLGTYEQIRDLDSEILSLVSKLPWYLQLSEDGQPPRLPEPLCEVITWQNHILRTCISTQRIRMYRPFLSERVEDAWTNVIKAAEDAMVVYRSLRMNRAPTSHQKFFAQAYQVFSVAVTVAALLLVEGSLPITNVYAQIKDMAMDLKILENQGSSVPVATHGRQVLLKMLALYDSRSTNPTSPEDAQRLVPDISVILGGENTTRAYMGRLATQQMNTPTTTASPAQQQVPPQEAAEQEGTHSMAESSVRNQLEAVFSPQSLIDPPWSGALEDLDPELFLEDVRPLGLLNWDMTGLLIDAQNTRMNDEL